MLFTMVMSVIHHLSYPSCVPLLCNTSMKHLVLFFTFPYQNLNTPYHWVPTGFKIKQVISCIYWLNMSTDAFNVWKTDTRNHEGQSLKCLCLYADTLKMLLTLVWFIHLSGCWGSPRTARTSRPWWTTSKWNYQRRTNKTEEVEKVLLYYIYCPQPLTVDVRKQLNELTEQLHSYIE